MPPDEQPVDGSVFGFPSTRSPAPTEEFFTDEPPAGPPAGAEAGPPPAPPGGAGAVPAPGAGESPGADRTAPQEPPAAAPATEPPAGGETAPAPTVEPVTFAGRTFPTMEAAEQSYREAQAMASREQQARSAHEQRNMELEAALAQAIPIVRQYQEGQAAPAPAGPDPAIAQMVEQMGLEPDQAAAVTAAFQGIVDARMAPIVEQQAQLAQQGQQSALSAEQRAYEQASIHAVGMLRQAHPEVQEYSEPERQLAEVLTDPVYRQHLSMTRPEDLEFAYMVAQNRDSFDRVLRANPHWLATPEGREYARYQASAVASQNGVPASPAASGNGVPAAGSAPTAPTPVRVAATVETGGSAPIEAAPGARRDEWTDVLDEWRLVQGADSHVFFGGMK